MKIRGGGAPGSGVFKDTFGIPISCGLHMNPLTGLASNSANFHQNWAGLAVLYSRQLLNGSHNFFQTFSIYFFNYFIKNPQTTIALPFLTHNVLAKSSVVSKYFRVNFYFKVHFVFTFLRSDSMKYKF